MSNNAGHHKFQGHESILAPALILSLFLSWIVIVFKCNNGYNFIRIFMEILCKIRKVFKGGRDEESGSIFNGRDVSYDPLMAASEYEGVDLEKVYIDEEGKLSARNCLCWKLYATTVIGRKNYCLVKSIK